MNALSEYHIVTFKGYPFKRSQETEIGCYFDKDLAWQMARLVRCAFEHQTANGIDIDVHSYMGKVVTTSDGDLRLKETPRGVITKILRNVDDVEMQRILHFTAIVLEPNLIKPRLLHDSPKEICEKPCYSVVFDFHPFDRSKSLVAGYFQLKQTAKTITEFILMAHFQKKVGFGFNTTIEKIKGKFVQYTSGKCYINVDEKHHEILATCNYLEFDRIFKELNEAISKWSHHKK